MRGFRCLILVGLVALVAVAPVLADSHQGGDIARVTYWKVASGSTAQFEAGIKAHNQLHADHDDPMPIFTGIIVTGKHQGEYVRGSLGHKWSDFDGEGAVPVEKDDADMAIHVAPYLEAARTVYYEYQPEISNSMGAPAPLARVVHFHLKPGHEQAFRGAIEKIHQALSDKNWPPYEWYIVADGGHQPTWIVVLARNSWAGFEPSDPDFATVVGQTYGEEAAGIFADLTGAIAGQYSHTIAFPAGLSYTPAGQ